MIERYGNSRLNKTIEKYDGSLASLDEPMYVDAYNGIIHEDGISSTIKCGVDFRNMDFVIEPVPDRGWINLTSDGMAHTIKANYYKVSLSNFRHTDGLTATGIVEFVD